MARLAVLSLLVCSFLVSLSGCGLAPLPAITIPTKPISILFVANPPTSMAVGASATIYAAVENSPANSVVDYVVSCGSATANSCGTLSLSDEVGAVVFTAPTTIPSSGSVTITATAEADATKSVSAKITITPPIAIKVAFSPPPPASVEVGASVTLNAAITNDVSANPQVKWAVSCGSADCGAINPTATSSNIESGYTAPAAIPSGNTVTVTATSVTDATKSASATFAITARGLTLADGAYVFSLSGPAGSTASFTTGVFVATHGTITGGEQDSIAYATDDNGGIYPYSYLSGEITGGSYASTSDGNLQISIISGQGGGEILNGVLASGGNGFVAQLYGAFGSGTLDRQTSTAAPAGGYVLSLFGGDRYGEEDWMGGILNFDGPGSISGAGSAIDLIDAGGAALPSGKETLGASTVTAPDKFGRIQFLLNTEADSALPVQDLVGYIVDPAHMRLVSSTYNNQGNYQGVMGGLALGQGAQTGHFSNSSLAGTSYVLGASTLQQYESYELAGVVTANADGTLGGTLNWNNLTANGTQTLLAVNGTWTIDATGRATLSNLTQPSNSNEPFTDSLHLYLTGDGNALLLSSEYANPVAGQAFQQQAGTFDAASLNGFHGLNAGVTNTTTTGATYPVVGTLTSLSGNGTDTLAGFADSGTAVEDFAIGGSFAPGSNGVFTGTMAGLDPASRTTNNSFTLYLVDERRGILIETDNAQLALGYLQSQK